MFGWYIDPVYFWYVFILCNELHNLDVVIAEFSQPGVLDTPRDSNTGPVISSSEGKIIIHTCH